MKPNSHNVQCFNGYLGRWLIELGRGQQLFDLIMRENLVFTTEKEATEVPEKKTQDERNAERDARLVTMTGSGVMIVPIEGTMMRGVSKWGGTSSVQIRRILRNAVSDSKVKAIMLKVDSPGGTVAGTDDLAIEIKNTDRIKPVHTHVDNLMASAAFWTGAQARHVTASRMSEIGSLGTVAVVHDMSEMAKMEGVKVHVISTGDHKGAFTPGSEVTKDQLADLQSIVDKLNSFFMDAVAEARGFTPKETKALFDGRVHVAEDALKLNLIDGISTFDEALLALEETIEDDTELAESEILLRARGMKLNNLEIPFDKGL